MNIEEEDRKTESEIQVEDHDYAYDDSALIQERHPN